MNKRIFALCLLSMNMNSFAMLGQARNYLNKKFAPKTYSKTFTATTTAATTSASRNGFLGTMAGYLAAEQGGDAVTAEEGYARVRPVPYLTALTIQTMDDLNRNEATIFDLGVTKIQGVEREVEQENEENKKYYMPPHITPPNLIRYPLVKETAYLDIIKKTLDNNRARIAELYDEDQRHVMALINKWESTLQDYALIEAASDNQRFDISIDTFNTLAKKYGTEPMYVSPPFRTKTPSIMGFIGRTHTLGDDSNREAHIATHTQLVKKIREEYDAALAELHKYGIYTSDKVQLPSKPKMHGHAEYSYLPDELDPKAYPKVYEATLAKFENKLTQLRLQEKEEHAAKLANQSWLVRAWKGFWRAFGYK